MIVFVLISVLAGSVWCDNGHLETVIIVAQCRASCLDQFSHLIRNKDNCMKSADCYMCWDMCKMITESFETWGGICLVSNACPAGCQLACDFMNAKNDSFPPSSTLMMRSAYHPQTDLVRIEWMPDCELKSESAVLYTVLLKNGDEEWHEIGQTTSQIMQIKRGLVGRDTEIRVLSVNATEQISDGKISHLGRDFYETWEESILKNPKNVWKPHLEILRRNSMGLQATIIWPAKQNENGTMEYEVSWSTIDEAIEITGHLHTNTTVAVLTLWTDAMYSIQVNYLVAADKTIHSQSEPLLIDTKSSHVSKEIERVVESSCPKDATLVVLVFCIFSLCFCVLLTTMTWILMRIRLMEKNGRKVEEKSKICRVFQACHVVSLSPKEKQAKISSEEEVQDFHNI